MTHSQLPLDRLLTQNITQLTDLKRTGIDVKNQLILAQITILKGYQVLRVRFFGLGTYKVIMLNSGAGSATN